MPEHVPRHAAPPRSDGPTGPRGHSGIKRQRQQRSLLGLVGVAVLVVGCIAVTTRGNGDDAAKTASGASTTVIGSDGKPAPTTTTLPPLQPYDGWVNPASSGREWSSKVDGLITFRGNPTRS